MPDSPEGVPALLALYLVLATLPRVKIVRRMDHKENSFFRTADLPDR